MEIETIDQIKKRHKREIDDLQATCEHPEERRNKMKVRFITAEEAAKGKDLPYYKEYCVEDLPFPRGLVCPHRRTTILNGKKYCVGCGEQLVE